VGAVALAEDAAAARNAVRALRAGEPRRLVDIEAEALDLLEEELARPRRAFVSRVNRRDAPILPEGVNEEGLAAGAHDGLEVLAPPVEMGQGVLDGLGLGDGREIEELPETPPGNAHPVIARRIDVAQHLQEVSAGVAVVGLDARVAEPDRAACVPLDGGRADRGSPDADSECLHVVPHEHAQREKTGRCPPTLQGLNGEEESRQRIQKNKGDYGQNARGVQGARQGPGCRQKKGMPSHPDRQSLKRLYLS